VESSVSALADMLKNEMSLLRETLNAEKEPVKKTLARKPSTSKASKKPAE